MIDDPLAPLRAMFAERAARDLSVIRRALTLDPPADPELETTVHGLAGAAGIFGHAEMAALALAADRDFVDGEAPDRERLEALAGLLEKLAL